MASTQTTVTTRVSVVHNGNHLLSWKEEFKPNKGEGAEIDGRDLLAKVKEFLGYAWELQPENCYIEPNFGLVFHLGKEHAAHVIQVKRDLEQCDTCGATKEHKSSWCPTCGGSVVAGKAATLADVLGIKREPKK